jgi:hypothetical protein
MQCLGIQMPNFYCSIFGYFVKFATRREQHELRPWAVHRSRDGQGRAVVRIPDSVGCGPDRVKPAWTRTLAPGP